MLSLLSIFSDPIIKSWSDGEIALFSLVIFFLMGLTFMILLGGASERSPRRPPPPLPTPRAPESLALVRPPEPASYPYVTTVRPPALPDEGGTHER